MAIKYDTNTDTIESLYEDDRGTFWWKHCSINGCPNMENREANTGKCHVHTYTGVHHKIARAWRKLMWKIGLNG